MGRPGADDEEVHKTDRELQVLQRSTLVLVAGS